MKQKGILIIGAKGQLGLALQKQYPKAKAVDIEQLDITNPQSLESFNWSGTKTILNAAAYTNVDGAETPEGRIAAWKINSQAVANLVNIALQKDLLVLHISTDYVFDGRQNPHTEEELLSPLSSYGASKAAGDVVLSLLPKYYLLRTSWLIGDGKNFVRSILALGQKDVSPKVVADQFGRPTFTAELVRIIDHLLSTWPDFGIYNSSNSGDTVSWAELARAIYKDAGFDKLSVGDTTAAEYFAGKVSAKRPVNSTFDLTKIEATGFKPKDWREDLAKYVKKELS